MPRTETRVRSTWLTPGVRGIGAASFLSDLSQEVSTSLLPRLVTSTLGAPVAALGLIEGLADAMGGLMRLVGGGLADDPGRRRAVAVGGYATTAVMTGLIGVAASVWQAGALRAAGWGARGLRTPARNALLADAVPPGSYGRAFGFERAMDNAGAVGGPLLALALVSLLSVRAALLLSMVPGLLAAASIVYAVRHLPEVAGARRARIRIAVGPVLKGRRLRKLMIAIAFFELGNVAGALLILRATEVATATRGLGPATRTALLLYLAYNLVAAATSVAAGHLSDRFGPVRVLVGGFGAFFGAYVLLAAASGVALVAVAFTVAGAGIACVETAQHSAVAAAAPADLRGSAFGVLAAVQSFGNLVASATSGLLWTLVSPAAAFAYAAVWMVLAALAARPVARGNEA
jgi:MFS family permease